MEINDVPVVVDFRVHRDAMVWPMVAAGTSNDDIKFARDMAPEWDRGRPLSHEPSHPVACWSRTSPASWPGSPGLFSRRGFNIESLAVGPTEHAEVSRMTIVVNVEDSPLEQVTKQLNKLVDVLKIVELEPDDVGQRELMLVKVRADADTRGQVLETVAAVPRQGRRRRPGRRHDRGHRQRRTSSTRPAAGAGAVRHPRARAVRRGRDRPRPPLDHRARPAPRSRRCRRPTRPVDRTP